ncbi:hypothetical protein BJ166DRAFT_103451 [Pestalotiopsis sp. NC0098]|nr:hypothetical protein BJ166DRAFT_103451 [Pestalotiopsis sp. NC0098]
MYTPRGVFALGGFRILALSAFSNKHTFGCMSSPGHTQAKLTPVLTMLVDMITATPLSAGACRSSAVCATAERPYSISSVTHNSSWMEPVHLKDDIAMFMF